jgi:hypothetical protein
MSVIFDLIVPVERNRGQGLPVDFLVKWCIEEGIHDIGHIERMWKVTFKPVDEEASETIEMMPFWAYNEARNEGKVKEAELTDTWEIDGN